MSFQKSEICHSYTQKRSILIQPRTDLENISSTKRVPLVILIDTKSSRGNFIRGRGKEKKNSSSLTALDRCPTRWRRRCTRATGGSPPTDIPVGEKAVECGFLENHCPPVISEHRRDKEGKKMSGKCICQSQNAFFVLWTNANAWFSPCGAPSFFNKFDKIGAAVW